MEKKKKTECNNLKFCCDWVLHPKINNVGTMRDMIEGIVARKGEVGADITSSVEMIYLKYYK